MTRPRIPSIRTRLAWLVAACFVPTCVIAAALVFAYHENEQARLTRDASASALALTFAVDRELIGVETALLALASSPNLSSRNLASFDLQARDIVTGKRIDNLMLADVGGQQLLNTRLPFGAPLPRVGDMGLIRNVTASRQTVVSDLSTGPVSQQPMVSIGVPVIRGEEVIYVLVASIIPERFAGVLIQQHDADGLVAVLDRNGAVVAQNRTVDNLIGQLAPQPLLAQMKTSNQGQIEDVSVQGQSARLFFNRSAYSGWTVSKIVFNDSLTRVLWRTAGWLIAALSLLLGSSVLLAWVMGGRIIRPLDNLSRAARRIGAGQHAELDTVDNSYAEIRTLSESFNGLIRQLLQKEADLTELNGTLERRVTQRTTQVTQALDTLRTNENRIRTIVETAQGAFIGVDFGGRITDWNTQAQTMLGWRREEILGQPMSTLVPPRFRDRVEQTLRAFAETGTASFVNTNLERLVLTQDGRELAVEIRIGLINTGKLKFFSAFLYDISQRKQVERMKSEFISTTSHELRTPLTAIYASLDLMQSGMAGELPPDARELLAISHNSAERLVRLVNNILDVEKIASHSMAYRKTRQALRPLVEQAIVATQAYADRYQVRFELNAGSSQALVTVDEDRITQVIVNLLSNAAKFSPAGGAVVHVDLRVVPGFARVSVTDSGSGIPAGFRDRLFERFAQVDASDHRQKDGTGLGLAICKSIVEAHQGRIDFVSPASGGCEFYFDLPLQPKD